MQFDSSTYEAATSLIMCMYCVAYCVLPREEQCSTQHLGDILFRVHLSERKVSFS